MRAPVLAALAALAALGAAMAVTVASAAALGVTSRPLTGSENCSLLGHSSTVVADTHVAQSAPSTNYGTVTPLRIGGANGDLRRGLIRFDLSACGAHLPPSAEVTSARLRLYLTAVPNGGQTLTTHRVTSCPEALATCWGEASVTWSNQPGFAATATASFTSLNGSGAQWAAWDVSNDVRQFHLGTAANNGWVIQTTANGEYQWRARETTSTAQAPQLIITYRR